MMRLESLEEFPVTRKRTKRPRPSSSASANSLVYSSEEDEDMANCLILLARGDSQKLSSRKFTQMATTTAGKVGIYVYVCKTCNRTFPSFQALGGHRASHKKPKLAADIELDEKRNSILLPSNKTTICHVNEQSKPKIHECSICGSEFASGQALGGHMRRHRAAVAPIDVSEKPRSMLALDLDLNLPAPPEDDKFNQFSANEQPSIVFSAAALLDCHY